MTTDPKTLCEATRQIAENVRAGVPPMPDGFTDRAAWDAIHWRFSEGGSVLDEAVIGWQRENQERVKAAVVAQADKQNDRMAADNGW